MPTEHHAEDCWTADRTRTCSLRSFRRPLPSRVRGFLAAQGDLPLTNGPVRQNDQICPDGYRLDAFPADVGQGHDAYMAACNTLTEHVCHLIPELELYRTGSGMQLGDAVATVTRGLVCWSVQANRVSEIIKSDTRARIRYGFVLATLPGHSLEGEERFLLEFDRVTNQVRFEIRTIVRPSAFLNRLLFPLIHRRYRQLRKQAVQAFQLLCEQRL